MHVSEQRNPSAMFPGVSVVLLALLLLSILAGLVAAGATTRFDYAMRTAVQAHASPYMTTAMRIVTVMGSGIVWLPGTIVLLVYFYLNGRPMAARLLLITVGGAAVLSFSMKELFHRPRPVPFFGITAPRSYSFPSGHALESLCFYGVVAALFSTRIRSSPLRVAVWTAAALLIIFVGFSRIYLGVHYPSDVLGGYLAALVWTAAMVRLIRRNRSVSAPG